MWFETTKCYGPDCPVGFWCSIWSKKQPSQDGVEEGGSHFKHQLSFLLQSLPTPQSRPNPALLFRCQACFFLAPT